LVRVKVCGIKRVEDLLAGVEAGADAVGFIFGFPSSPRNLSVKEVKELVRKVPVFVDSVLVTREDAGLVEFIVREINPDCLQLYGEPRVDEYKDLTEGIKLIRALDAGKDALKAAKEALSIGYDAVMLDNGRGTGKVLDWSLCRKVRDGIYPKPFILSGGLNCNNVLEAIKAVKPYAVDASSGLEASKGVKDANLVKEFVKVVKGWL
jgi:phosphoribosylanthranilate isomerase